MIALSHPVPGAALGDPFGYRAAIPGVTAAGLHDGADYPAAPGTPIRAAAAGTVSWVGWSDYGGGYGVVLDHGDARETLYFHMREKSGDVKVGQRVAAGDVIGRVGSTGSATGAHLHFSLRVNNVHQDPVPHINAKSNNNIVDGEDDMNGLWVADVKGSWFLIVPIGGGKKPNAVLLYDSGLGGGGAARMGIPVVGLDSIVSLRRVATY